MLGANDDKNIVNKIDIDLLEYTINEILSGLTMYVRDVDLDSNLSAIYKTGMIIMERGFTDASCRVMGMITTHRYSILSNHMVDLQEYEHGTNWGLFVAQPNAHYKVLDIYEYQGKTQILLIHLPNDSRWKLFENIEFNIEKDIIDNCRSSFEKKCLAEPIADLTTDEWLSRCIMPIGMSEDGVLFY